MTRYMIGASLAAVLAFASLVGLAPAADAAGSVSVSRAVLEPSSLFNQCTNENVELGGTALGLIDIDPTDNHFTFHVVAIDVSGIGETSGARYVAVFDITIRFDGSFEDGPFAETNAVHSRLITPGGGNDLDFCVIFHMTINANGDPTVFVNRVVEERCA